MTDCSYKLRIHTVTEIVERNTNTQMSKLVVDAACMVCAENIEKVEIVDNRNGKVKSVFYH